MLAGSELKLSKSFKEAALSELNSRVKQTGEKATKSEIALLCDKSNWGRILPGVKFNPWYLTASHVKNDMIWGSYMRTGKDADGLIVHQTHTAPVCT